MAPRSSALRAAGGLASALSLLLTLLPVSTSAQDVEITLDGGVSHALPPPGVEGPSATYARGGLRLRLPGEGGSFFGVLAGGASLDDGVGSWGWGSLGAERWGRFSPALGWRLSLTGTGFLVGEPTRYEAVVARLRPELLVAVGSGLLVAGAEGGVGRSEVTTPDGPVETDLWSAGGDLELRQPLGRATLRVGAGGIDTGSGSYGTAWVGLEGRLGPAWALAELRAWSTPTDDFEATGSLRISLELGPSLVGWIGGGRSDPDPLLGTPPGDFVGSGLSWTVVAPDPAAELPARVVDPGNGRVAFRLDAGAAERVVVVGDFSGWSEVPLERRDGRWVRELTLEPGLYHYAFVVDGEWRVPEGAPGRTEDEWGRPTATLLVPEPGQGAGGRQGGPDRVTSGRSDSSTVRRIAERGSRPHCTECP